jgi:hypothetical protein
MITFNQNDLNEVNHKKNEENVQNVEDGIAPASNGPFTITDKFGKMARTHKRDGLYAGPDAGSNHGGGSMKHKFDNININGTIEIKFPGGESTNIHMNSESIKRKITKDVQDGIIKNLNMGKLK